MGWSWAAACGVQGWGHIVRPRAQLVLTLRAVKPYTVGQNDRVEQFLPRDDRYYPSSPPTPVYGHLSRVTPPVTHVSKRLKDIKLFSQHLLGQLFSFLSPNAVAKFVV